MNLFRIFWNFFEFIWIRESSEGPVGKLDCQIRQEGNIDSLQQLGLRRKHRRRVKNGWGRGQRVIQNYLHVFTWTQRRNAQQKGIHMMVGQSCEQPKFQFLLFRCPICNRYNIWSKGEVLPELNRGHRIYVAYYSMVNTARNIGKSVYEPDGHCKRKKIWNRGIRGACLSS